MTNATLAVPYIRKIIHKIRLGNMGWMPLMDKESYTQETDAGRYVRMQPDMVIKIVNRGEKQGHARGEFQFDEQHVCILYIHAVPFNGNNFLLISRVFITFSVSFHFMFLFLPSLRHLSLSHSIHSFFFINKLRAVSFVAFTFNLSLLPFAHPLKLLLCDGSELIRKIT